jgi:hypothetical protein
MSLSEAADKRRFFLRMGWPHGERLCEVMGFPAPSRDVADAEAALVETELAQMALIGVSFRTPLYVRWVLDWLKVSDAASWSDDEEVTGASMLLHGWLLSTLAALSEDGFVVFTAGGHDGE